MDKFTFAEKVAADFAKSNKRFAMFAGDGTFRDFLEWLFEKLGPLLGGCLLSPKEAAQKALDGGLIGRWYRSRLNRHVREEIDDFGLADELTTPLVGSILKVVAALA